MPHPDALDRLVREISTQVRWRRAEHYGLRGLFWGVVAAVVPLLLRTVLGPWALALALALVATGAVAGVAWGLLKRVDPFDAARLADRAFGLADRLTTALEWGDRAERTRLVNSLVADATERVEKVELRQVVRRIVVPCLRGTTMVIFVATIVTVLKVFDIVRVATNGQFETNVIANEMLKQAISRRDTGRASALAILLLLLMLPFLLGSVWWTRRRSRP